MSHHLFDHPATLDDVPYSRRAGKVCGAPVPREDVPRAFADNEDDTFALFRGVVNALWMGVALWLVIAALGVWALDIATGGNTFADIRAWAGL